MEIVSVLPELKKLSLRQWLAVVGCTLVLLTGLAAGMSYITQSPIISQGDYSPFSNKAEYEQFYKDHPAMTKQPPHTMPFSIKTSISPDKQAVYQIYLLQLPIKPDNPNSITTYKKSLKEYQQQAKDWLIAQGEDLDKVYVQWIPNPD